MTRAHDKRTWRRWSGVLGGAAAGCLCGLSCVGCAALLLDEATCGEGLAGCDPESGGGSPNGGSGGVSGSGGTGGAGAGGAGGGASGGGGTGGAGASDVQGVDDPSDAGVDAEAPDVDTSDPCTAYCDDITGYCIDEDDQQYESVAACRALCGFYDRGSPGDEDRTTLGCRISALGGIENVPVAERAAQCQAAGPAGDPPGDSEGCGTGCDNYCQLMESICLDRFNDSFGDRAQCLQTCDGLDAEAEGGYNNSRNAGNTAQCRVWHLVVAATYAVDGRAGNVAEHCGHAVGERGPANQPFCSVVTDP